MCVLSNKESSLLMSDTWCGFFWYSNLISHTQTQSHKQIHTAHSGARRLTHPHKYIFTPPTICSQQLSLLHWMDNALISKNYFPRCLFFSRIIHLQRWYICWLEAIRLGSSNNTGVNKQNTHTTNTQRKITLGRVS